MGLDNNLYYTVNNPNKHVTVGKVDTRPAGQVRKVNNNVGNIFHRPRADARRRRQLLVRRQRAGAASGKLDVKTEKITVYQTPQTCRRSAAPVTMDVDGKGKIWASARTASTIDPATEKFTD